MQMERDNESLQEQAKKKPPTLINADYHDGKENAAPEKFPQRNKLLRRRERSSRVTTHRKPFVVDIRNFGSVPSNKASGHCKKPQDVRTFWEAAEEREASEAIIRKLKGQNDDKSGYGDPALRRVGVRRTNSQRTTTRLRRFTVQLPACADRVQSWGEEQLEEEDATEESSFTFLSDPDIRPQNHLFELLNATKYFEPAQVPSSVQLAVRNADIADLDGATEVSRQEDDFLSDGNSPLLNPQCTGQCESGTAGIIDYKDVSDRSKKQSQGPEVSAHVPSHEDMEADSENKIVAEDIDTENELKIYATSYNRNIAMKKTPCTSPIPPSNPLAALGLRKDGVIEDISKRRLNFDDGNMNSITIELDSSSLTAQVLPGPKNPSVNPDDPEALVEVLPVLHDPSAQTKASQGHVDVTSFTDVMVVHEEHLEVAENTSRKTPDLIPTVTKKIPKKHAFKKANAKRKKLMDDRRHSLIGAGTNWTKGRRCSTRIRSRPLEWWRGERFLRGRVQKSLPTVIGIKYSSPYPYWPKRGTAAPRFKVESYVSKEFAKKVEFAALY